MYPSSKTIPFPRRVPGTERTQVPATENPIIENVCDRFTAYVPAGALPPPAVYGWKCRGEVVGNRKKR